MDLTLVDTQTFVMVNGTDVAQPVAVTSPNLHDLQVYGIVVTIILCFIVFGGVKIINRVAPAFLVPVVFSLFCIFIGIFLARKDYPTGECLYFFHLCVLFIIFSHGAGAQSCHFGLCLGSVFNSLMTLCVPMH